MNGSCDVLVVGAGPTGMVLALALRRSGVDVRIIDQAEHAGTASRALAVQARTLELYGQLGLSDDVIRQGHRAEGFNLWSDGRHKARFSLADIGKDLTPYSFLLIYPQDRHERLLESRLAAAGVAVERGTQLLGYSEEPDGVRARLRAADGREHVCEARYLAGCDGARSAVRREMGVDFPGGTYARVFYVADVEGHGPAMNGEIHVNFDESDFVAVFGMSGTGQARLIGTVREESEERARALRFDDVSRRAIGSLGVGVDRLNWFSTYRVHHRVAAHFRKGRAFLAGDAGHIHSPAGGQGMNTGIGDAFNLGWKLAAVLAGRAGDALLDSYEAERIGFARRLVDTTDRVFTLATAEGHVADVVRRRLVPNLMPLLSHVDAAREFLFRTISQTVLHYRSGPLAEGVAGKLHGGDRMPWAPSPQGDNFEPLKQPVWQVHVYGAAPAALSEWCASRRLPLHVFPWHPVHDAAGLLENAMYLVRPDAYIALAAREADPAGLARFFAVRALSTG
ncbi:FAD-dependent monooxygenase [Noviherbaspirillum aridicola]|uniref:2-polyprenyl-6-methoxyphenol hydroxylase n=1 Tax=Noviherbaspirillum aridicola TaxID=2849687 RepID=A0ABQ4PZ54_9BURK|nr:FAD-dependent monooxygenase [Noviherbaspirillum aridicola]GIZ50105.1 2-polyprenyl-6-methoxyphenol hydroxylase [Noviherbaspirillum aridicola]